MTDGTPDLASAARRLLDWWDREGQRIVPPRASLQSVAVPRDEIAHLRAALAAHDQQGEPVTIDVDGCLACGRWVSTHFMVDPTLVTQEERDRWHNGGHLEPVEKSCPGCKRYWGVSDTPEPPPEPCKTCQDRGWVWEGNASAGEGTPADCPDPVHASDYAGETWAPATPEGGEPTDDELLARAEWDIKVLRAGNGTADIGDDMAELAAALRDARRKSSVEIRHLIDKCDRLERELAEARPHGEVLARVTTQSSGYAKRLPDGSIDMDEGGTTSLVKLYHVPVPPGTEVLVVRPTDTETNDGE